MIHAVVIGHLGADAELRYTDGGMAVLRMRVASSTHLKVGGEYKDVATWVNVDVVGKRAESLAKVNLKKGSRIGARGSLYQREYERRDGGGKGYSLDLRADDIELLGDKKGEGQTSSYGQSTQAPRPAPQPAPAQSQTRQAPAQQSFADAGYPDADAGYNDDDLPPF